MPFPTSSHVRYSSRFSSPASTLLFNKRYARSAHAQHSARIPPLVPPRPRQSVIPDCHVQPIVQHKSNHPVRPSRHQPATAAKSKSTQTAQIIPQRPPIFSSRIFFRHSRIHSLYELKKTRHSALDPVRLRQPRLASCSFTQGFSSRYLFNPGVFVGGGSCDIAFVSLASGFHPAGTGDGDVVLFCPTAGFCFSLNFEQHHHRCLVA